MMASNGQFDDQPEVGGKRVSWLRRNRCSSLRRCRFLLRLFLQCPLCLEPFGIDDITFFPCACRYQVRINSRESVLEKLEELYSRVFVPTLFPIPSLSLISNCLLFVVNE